MIRTTTLALLVGALCAPVSGAMYTQVFSHDQAAGSVTDSPFLDAVAVSGGVAYAITRDTTAANVGSVVAFDGSTFTELMDVAAWQATGTDSDIAGSSGASVVGDKLRFVSFFSNSIWEVDVNTGAVAEVVSAAMINGFTGGTANLTASSEVLSDGTAFAYDGDSDSVLQITPGGFVFNLISSAELTALTTSDILSGTGFTLVGSDLYFGSNSSDSLYKWNIFSDTGSLVLDTAQLEALSDDIDGNAGVDDIFLAPDGLVYFYEDDADYLYSFDPADPAGSLSVVLTEAELAAGPGTDMIGQLAWWNGRIAWTDQRDGFFALVPEPTGAVLALAAVCGLAARRR